MVLLLLLVFIIGALSVVAVEAAGLWFLIRWLNRKVEREEIRAKSTASVSCSGNLNPGLDEKQGALWVLEPDKVPTYGLEVKLPMEQRRRKEIVEVIPVRKYAKIKDNYLILLESDGSSVEILLRGCTIVAVSASSLSSRKWAKKYPIKVESKDSAIYKGYKIIYIYLETSWEKESWCKALRLASYYGEEKLVWFSKLSEEFQYYLASLNAGYPSFMKPGSVLNAELVDKSIKHDNSSSKVRQFLKKLTKKASKSGHDYKGSGNLISSLEERKISEKSRSFQDLSLANGVVKMEPTGQSPNVSFDDTSVTSSTSTSTEPGSGSNLPGISETSSSQKNVDEGALCLNLLISRLFFDAKNNPQIRSSIQNRIQRSLSDMRTPNYIGEITCTGLDLGTLPPRVLAMRVLPSDMNEVWSLEIDVEYSGGIVLDIETRLEIRELEVEGSETQFDSNSACEVTSDLLEGFGNQLKLSEDAINEIRQKNEEDNVAEETENSKNTAQSSSQGSKWKSLLHSITKQVSQVPLSLGIRFTSLSGTMRLRMKPPPSDRIWYGFTSMPDIEFNLESHVGDHKITSGHLALFLISRFKAAIRETLVLPNSESVAIPWMSAEKDDWVPRKVAPFMWYKNNRDFITNTTKREAPCFLNVETTRTVEPNHENSTRSEINSETPKDFSSIQQLRSVSMNTNASSSSSIDDSTMNATLYQESRAPSIKKDRMHESLPRWSTVEKPELGLRSRSLASSSQNGEDDDKPKKLGTRERMLGLGKKMGEKLEVKRRNFEERGRSFVERMREI